MASELYAALTTKDSSGHLDSNRIGQVLSKNAVNARFDFSTMSFEGLDEVAVTTLAQAINEFHLPFIQKLSFSGCGLRDELLHIFLDQLKTNQVAELDISHNQLAALDFLADFAHQFKVVSLNISNNARLEIDAQNKVIEKLWNPELKRLFLNDPINNDTLERILDLFIQSNSNLIEINFDQTLTELDGKKVRFLKTFLDTNRQASLPFLTSSSDATTIEKLLSVQPTIPQKILSFHNVYRVDLGEEYQQLLSLLHQAPDDDEHLKANPQSYIETIDTRPFKVWYPALDDHFIQMGFLKSDLACVDYELRIISQELTEIFESTPKEVVQRIYSLKQNQNQVSNSQNSVQPLVASSQPAVSSSTFRDYPALYEKQKSLRLARMKLINQIRQLKRSYGEIITELHANGFDICEGSEDRPAYADFVDQIREGDNIEDNEDEYVQFLIYRLAPIVADPKVFSNVAVGLPDSKDVENFSNWEQIAASVAKMLQGCFAADHELEQQFNNEYEVLGNFESCEELVKAQHDLQAQIEDCQHQIDQQKSASTSGGASTSTSEVPLSERVARWRPSISAPPIAFRLRSFNFNAKPPSSVSVSGFDLNQHLNDLTKKLQDLQDNGLSQQRQKFISNWTTPAKFKKRTKRRFVSKFTDPLAVYLQNLRKAVLDEQEREMGSTRAIPDVYFFGETPNGLYNQFNQSLAEFLQLTVGEEVVAVLPKYSNDQRSIPGVYQAIENPYKYTSGKFSTIGVKFVEEHAMYLQWLGYSFSALGKAISLAPEDERKITVETQTSLTQQLTSSTSSDKTSQTTASSSFEENLKSEFATTTADERAAKESQQASQSTQAKTSSSTDATSADKTEDSSDLKQHWDVSAQASFSFGIGSASVNASYGGTSDDSHKHESSWSTNSKSGYEQAQNVASQTAGESSNHASRSAQAKNVSEGIKKVGTQTSEANKLTVSSTSTSSQSQTSKNVEEMTLKNPNAGRTINYNFFQYNNLYKCSTDRSGVKIVVNTGRELIEKSRVPHTRVYDVIMFNHIYSDLVLDKAFENAKDQAVLLSMLIVANVFLSYIDSEIPALEADRPLSPAIKAIYELRELPPQEMLDHEGGAIKFYENRLKDLESWKFTLIPNQVLVSETLEVKAPAYYVDSQLGYMPAMETFIESKRGLELQRMQHELEGAKLQNQHLAARTRAGMFAYPYPNSLTQLTVVDPQMISGLEALPRGDGLGFGSSSGKK